ncbi:MBL fold metallo-hydrolase [Poriferisphaera sp. WC338]|uniref:MBL fold metallo-hydrolase n=1 Tax=Poriferisphaera sp. WC338 TaxID=3425129 RepID=UPI003D8147AF
MVPREPARNPNLGFLYVPPYRIQGISIAGEQTVIQVPELDLTFDIGLCPRATLTSNYAALTHGHMDHAAGIAYYFSQRYFQGMGIGTVICPKPIEQAIHNVMSAWVDLEAQKTPYKVLGFEPGDELEIKNNIFLRAFETQHTVPSLGYNVIEKRSKLRPDLVGLPQEQLLKLKEQGEEITQILRIPLVCYTGDTMWGPHFENEEVLGSQILITECTFLESDHKSRASVGKHLHLDNIAELMERATSEAVVLVHTSRRTHISQVRKMVLDRVPRKHHDRLFVLMDNRTNKLRYQKQMAEAEALEQK